MEINAYQQCPCHSERKIKFCCGKEIINDLNQVVALNQAKQSIAAVDQIDRLIAKFGPKDCLLTMKTFILINLNEIDKAAETNDQFLASSPNHPIGFQHRALVCLGKNDLIGAVENLQNAMDVIGENVPNSIGSVFRLVGIAMLQVGAPSAARAHLTFASQLVEEDEELRMLILETYRMTTPSILMKYDAPLDEVSQDVPWSKPFAQIRRLAIRGQWRMALRKLKKLDEQYPDEPSILRATTIMESRLGDREGMFSAYRALAHCSKLDESNAVEAESLAQLYDNEPIAPELDIVRVSFEIKDINGLLEKSTNVDRIVAVPGADRFETEDGSPPPKAAFIVLDRDQLDSADGMTVDNVPCTTGEILVFGRQTDCEPRLEWIATNDEKYEQTMKLIVDSFGDYLGEPFDTEVVGENSVVANVLTWQWHLPQGTTRAQHQTLMQEARRDALLERWTNIPFTVLDNKSPREVASDKKYRRPLLALIYHLENSSDQEAFAGEQVKELREVLGLPQVEKIDPADLDLSALSPARQRNLEFEKLTDEQLLQLYVHAMSIGNWPVLRSVGPVILERPELEESVPLDNVYAMLARIAVDDESSLENIKKARQFATSKGSPIGIWLVQELEIRLERGISEKCQDLLEEIQTRHLAEPDVEMQLARVLHRFGFIRPDGSVANEPPGSAAASPQPDSAIWTPDSQDEAVTQEGEASKLWIPGSD